jgi:hypothetical protein
MLRCTPSPGIKVRGMARRILLTCLVLTLAAVPAAAAKHLQNFVSPSKLISCISEAHGIKGVECSTPYLHASEEGDPFYNLEPHGKAHLGARGDYVGYNHPTHGTLQYGHTWTRNGIRCKMKTSGLTCRNKSHHGFHLAKGNTYSF